MEESSPATTTAAATAKTNDGQDLSELLRSMTTTTTIERFDDDDKVAVAPSSAQVPVLPTTETNAGGSFLPQASAVPASISRSYKVWGIPTHAFCQVFSDRIVLGVTQLQTKSKTLQEPQSSGHIGSWVYCQASRSPIDPKQVDYELSTLLGGGRPSAVDEKEIYARRIAERLLEKKSIPGGTDRMVVLLGISLLSIPPSASIDRFKTLVEVLVELVEEALQIVLG